MSEEPKKRRGRGKGKKPALVHVTLRLTPTTLEHFNTFFSNPTRKMRTVLEDYVTENKME